MRIFFAPLKTWWRSIGRRYTQDVENQSGLQPGLLERVSHELRTSLTGIVGYAEYLEVGSTEPMMKFTANIIRESGLDLARASRAYFDLQYLTHHQVRQTHSRFFLADVTREVLEKFESKAIQQDVRLVFDCSKNANSQPMRSDIDRIRQVLDALIFDAIQTVDKWSCIRLDLSFDESKKILIWTFEISASKGGQMIAELHEQFWNNDHYHFRLQQGPGVELALAKALIEFLGGEVFYRVKLGSPSQLVVMFPLNERNLDQETS